MIKVLRRTVMEVLVKAQKEVMTGNHAIARGLVEAGLELAAACPGTPGSEILPGIVRFGREEHRKVYAEWSVNERCAFEAAFGAALEGGRAACAMKQTGLNVAFPSLLKGKGKALKGALVVVSCDDPGSRTSQTEQDTRLLATLFGIPVFDPASPKEAGDVAYHALTYSFEHKTPVILRATHRVSHASEAVPLYSAGERKVVLEEGIQMGRGGKLGIIASGMSCSPAFDILNEMHLEESVSLYKVIKVFPPDPSLFEFVKSVDKALVIEETDAVLEELAGHGDKVRGRRNGFVPGEGELTYDVVRGIIERVLNESGSPAGGGERFEPDPSIRGEREVVSPDAHPPLVCAGRPRGLSLHAMKQVFPEAVFTGGMGCSGLGAIMGAVDTCLDPGGTVNLAAGLHDTFLQDGSLVPVIASVTGSTFFHDCLASLYDAACKEKRFILVIMDNSATAMAGLRPTPQTGVRVDGTCAPPITIEEIIGSFGIKFVRIVDSGNAPLMSDTLKEAYFFLKDEGKFPAVIIARGEYPLLFCESKEPTFDPPVLAEATVKDG
jgi:indolepyruvate ferredoxin oxidoreductase, alpha subunit